MKRYHVTFHEYEGEFDASALAETVGGTVRSTARNYDSEGHDLALIDLDENADRDELERLLDEDESVIGYHVSNVD